jgi:hypothetical protein
MSNHLTNPRRLFSDFFFCPAHLKIEFEILYVKVYKRRFPQKNKIGNSLAVKAYCSYTLRSYICLNRIFRQSSRLHFLQKTDVGSFENEEGMIYKNNFKKRLLSNFNIGNFKFYILTETLGL